MFKFLAYPQNIGLIKDLGQDKVSGSAICDKICRFSGPKIDKNGRYFGDSQKDAISIIRITYYK